MPTENLTLAIYILFGIWLVVSIYETFTSYHFVRDSDMTLNVYIKWRLKQTSKSFLICILITALILIINYIFV